MSIERKALVLGAGIIGLTAAQILQRCGWQVLILHRGEAASRHVALPEHTWQMLNEIWDCDIADMCRHRKLVGRNVSWSTDDVVDFPAESLSVDVGALSEAMRRRLGSEVAIEVLENESEFELPPERMVFDARGIAGSDSPNTVCGERVMWIWPSLPADPALTDRAEIRSGNGCWLFVLPIGEDSVSVQLATPSGACNVEDLLADLENIEGQHPSHLSALMFSTERRLQPPQTQVSIAPSKGQASEGVLRFAIGDRAMRFDPICGDGLGQGVKSAILAVAAANVCDGPLPAERIRQHVESRHAHAFVSHLRICARYYRAVPESEAWRGEITTTEAAIRDMTGSDCGDRSTCHLHFAGQTNGMRWQTGPRLSVARK